MDERIGDSGGREELRVNIRRLAVVVLEKLEEGSREKTADAAQIRLLGGIALRVLRLWRQSLLEEGSVGHPERRVQDVERALTGALGESRKGEGVKAGRQG